MDSGDLLGVIAGNLLEIPETLKVFYLRKSFDSKGLGRSADLFSENRGKTGSVPWTYSAERL